MLAELEALALIVAGELSISVADLRHLGGSEELQSEEDLAILDEEGDIMRSYFENGTGAVFAAETVVEEACVVGP